MNAPLTILYSGSFNPPHRGHLAVADAVLDRYPDAELWLAVSPQNPLKQADDLAPEADRVKMTELALSEARHRDRISLCSVESELPRPTATVDTLSELARRYPGRHFALLIGSDNAAGFCRWIRYREILETYPVLVYPREGYPMPGGDLSEKFILLGDLPLKEGEGTCIRRRIASGEEPGELLPAAVRDYIREHGLYGPDAEFYLARGREHHREGRFGEAYNDFLRANELDPENTEAREFLGLLKEIFAFRDPERYNP